MSNQRRVTVIQPTVHHYPIHEDGYLKKKRVCAYARVSTDQEDQIHSYKAQIQEYTRIIQENPQWIFQGMYADEGLSGTSIKNRLQFQAMIADAKAGKIDLILTKSISRFARNTVDSLTVVRELRGMKVEVYFEKENLYSSDPKVDFMLTIFSSIAQEESRNISENVKWGVRKRFKEGVVHLNTKRFLGYDKDESGKIVINEEQAETVQLIYNLYLAGYSTREIAEHLTSNNIKNGRGVVFWKPATITVILTNEKYCGDVILQKRVTLDYLTHKSVVNTGQVPKYHISDNHEPIISKELFWLVQNLKKERSQETNATRFANRFLLSGLVVCGVCGRKMNRQHYNPNTPFFRVVLSCKNRSSNRCACSNLPMDNQSLEALSTHVFHTLYQASPGLLDQMKTLLQPNLSTPKLRETIDEVKLDMIHLENEIKSLIQLQISNTKKGQDKLYKEFYDEKREALAKLQTKCENLEKTMMNQHVNQERLSQITQAIQQPEALLNRDTLTSVISHIIVLSPTNVRFVLAIPLESPTQLIVTKQEGTFQGIHWAVVKGEVE